MLKIYENGNYIIDPNIIEESVKGMFKYLDVVFQVGSMGKMQDNSIYGMATLRKDATNLPVNIWVDDGMAYKRAEHSLRIKFQPDKGNHPKTGDFASRSMHRLEKIQE